MSDIIEGPPENEWAASIVRAWEDSDKQSRPAIELWAELGI